MAKFCPHCGASLAKGHSFEYALDGASSAADPVPGQSLADKALTTGLVALAVFAGVLADAWSPVWVALVPLAYLLSPSLIRVLTKLPKIEKSHYTTLRVEHSEKSVDGRNVIIDEFPPHIEVNHIRHIAEKCLPKPVGDGLTFSRPNVCQPGKLSQGDFRIIRDIWLESNHCFYRNPLVKNQGLVLTERCYRLLKRVVDGC